MAKMKMYPGLVPSVEGLRIAKAIRDNLLVDNRLSPAQRALVVAQYGRVIEGVMERGGTNS